MPPRLLWAQSPEGEIFITYAIEPTDSLRIEVKDAGETSVLELTAVTGGRKVNDTIELFGKVGENGEVETKRTLRGYELSLIRIGEPWPRLQRRTGAANVGIDWEKWDDCE